MTDKHHPIVWETDLPLFSRRMMAQWAYAMLATFAVMVLILGTVFVAQGEWDAVPPMLMMAATVTAGLWLLGVLIMALLFRGKFRVRYRLDDRELRYQVVERKAKVANRLAIVAGALARSPRTLGAGLIAKSQETMAVRWEGAFRAVYDPGRHHITLRNAWRGLFWVQCTPENYAEVAAAIERNMAQQQTASRLAAGSPLPAYLGRSTLVVLACLPLFPLAEEYDTGLFMPIFILCFGLATVWLINLFGWAVLGGLLVQGVLVAADMLRLRESFFRKSETYRGYEVLGPADYELLLLAGIGAGILIWLALRAIRGRWLAALLDGYKDMG
jgi:hypothetical protein